MGPKIALVPFLDLTKGVEPDTKREIGNTMVRTGVGAALMLVFLSWILVQLLHFKPGVANIAGGLLVHRHG